MAEITYQMVLSTLQTAGLLVGIFYYILTLRNAQHTRELSLKAQEQAAETRKTQLLMQYTEKLSRPDIIEARVKFEKFDWVTASDFIQDFSSVEGRKVIVTVDREDSIQINPPLI